MLLAPPSPKTQCGHGDNPGLHALPRPLQWLVTRNLRVRGWVDGWVRAHNRVFVNFWLISPLSHSSPCVRWRRAVIVLGSFSAGGRGCSVPDNMR